MAIQELVKEDVEIVAGGAFSLGGAVFCGALGFAAAGPLGGVVGFIGGGILCP